MKRKKNPQIFTKTSNTIFARNNTQKWRKISPIRRRTLALQIESIFGPVRVVFPALFNNKTHLYKTPPFCFTHILDFTQSENRRGSRAVDQSCQTSGVWFDKQADARTQPQTYTVVWGCVKCASSWCVKMKATHKCVVCESGSGAHWSYGLSVDAFS